ncbi:hypothetical protein K2173_002575 [Erythroxylum novogranatense]|uniref:Uncharacterized protein n=1 Tax=Erythroxylum novogranatense TaxID=1862640 RepID=A0AAV8TR05_9ROSI|nr:hypothetical protein K2173_002575 [Erythroxylum novogranatense]
MDLRLVKKSVIDYSRKNKRWVLLLLTLGFSSYTIVIVSNDLKAFLQSNSDQIPIILKQISIMARSNEFFKYVVSRGNISDNASFLDKVFHNLSTPVGSGFVFVIAGNFASNMLICIYQIIESSKEMNSDAAHNNGNINYHVGSEITLIGGCIQLFASTAVTMLGLIIHINNYDEIFVGLTNPKHKVKVRDLLISICNGATETLVKTSHKVLTRCDSKVDWDSSLCSLSLTIHQEDIDQVDSKTFYTEMKPRKLVSEVKESGWIDKVPSTLAVPSNKRLAIDVIERVTFDLS